MRTLYTVAATVALGGAALAGVSVLSGKKASTVSQAAQTQSTGVKTATIPVEGMFCLSCAARIKSRLKSLDGVSNVEVRFADRAVKLSYFPARGDVPQRAAAAIDALGYKAGTPVAAR